MKSYRFTHEEHDYMRNLRKNYLKFGYEFTRWPEVYWVHSEFGQNTEVFIEKINRVDEEDPYCNPDYLGVYQYGYGTEGIIKLYSDRIAEASERLAGYLKIDPIYTRDLLKFKVLMHELGHWFTHWCHTDNRNNRQSEFSNQGRVVVETMAQLTVVWAIKGRNNKFTRDVNKLFDFMVPRQPYEYKQFKRLGKKVTHMGTLLKRYNRILDYLTDDEEFLLTGKSRYR